MPMEELGPGPQKPTFQLLYLPKQGCPKHVWGAPSYDIIPDFLTTPSSKNAERSKADFPTKPGSLPFCCLATESKLRHANQ